MIDKDIEENRYNKSAKNTLKNNDIFSVNNLTLPLKTPYFFYQSIIDKYANNDSLILEVGAGMGEKYRAFTGDWGEDLFD